MYLGVMTSEQQAKLNQIEADLRPICTQEEKDKFPLMPILLGGAIGALVKPSHRSDGAVTGALYGLIASLILKTTHVSLCNYLPQRIAEMRRQGRV